MDHSCTVGHPGALMENSLSQNPNESLSQGLSQSFRKMTVDERLRYLGERFLLTDEELRQLQGAPLSTEIAEHLIENAIGYFQIPLGIASHFRIDGRDFLIPMAVEETSIIAAA